MLFERYRATHSNENSFMDIYYSEAAVHDTAAITVRMTNTIWPEINDLCFWLLDEINGIATLPQFVYDVWEDNCDNLDQSVDEFVITFTDLRDFIMFKLRYSDYIGQMEVHVRETNGDYPEIHIIQNLNDLLKFRPHLQEQLDALGNP